MPSTRHPYHLGLHTGSLTQPRLIIDSETSGDDETQNNQTVKGEDVDDGGTNDNNPDNTITNDGIVDDGPADHADSGGVDIHMMYNGGTGTLVAWTTVTLWTPVAPWTMTL